MHGERIKHARQHDGAHDSTISQQCLRHWPPARDNQSSGPGDKPFSSIRSLRCTRQDIISGARRTTAHLHPCARHTRRRASDSPDKAQHQLRPPKLRIPIPCYTSYSTISPSYTPLPRVMTTLALRTSLILVVGFHTVCRCIISDTRTARRASLGSQ